MTSTISNVSARSAAFALYQLDLPAVHPDSVIRCIKSVIEAKSALVRLAQTDPAVAIILLKLCRQNNIDFSFESLDFGRLISKIPGRNILKTFITLKTFDIDNLHSQIPISGLNKTSAARAYAARLIAAQTGQANESLSFLAAFFADIGLFAMAEIFPKSLSQLLEESKGNNSVLLKLEKENLGLTHNVISRQLAQKWLLPQAVADSAWLYCSPAVQKLDNLANIEIILTVRLADMLVKTITTGAEPVIVPPAISLNAQDISKITDEIKDFLAQMSTNISDRQNLYTQTIKQAFISLLENPTDCNYSDFLSAVNSVSSAIDAAAVIARLICKIYNAQKVCIYLNSNEAVKAAGDKTEFLIFANSPSPEDIDFEPANTQRVKLDTIGEMFIQTLENPDISSITSLAAQLISAKQNEEHNLSIAQSLLDDVTHLSQEQQSPAANPVQAKDDLREIVAEIAAGAAHELNNPLTVISGRAQMLKQGETDETKKIVLDQITEKTGQAYEIVGQLMSYARPAQPQVRTVSPFIMINNCLEKVNAYYLSEPLDIHIDNVENLSDIEVDPDQIADAIARIIYNALESYESGNGPVIIAGNEHLQNFVELRIQDQGCGMSDETLKKAAEPFYSDKPAGRQRGMGLAIASSLLKNNGCTISIESQMDKGTTVTIRLPRSQKSENS